MGQLSMPYTKLRNEILLARDLRQEKLTDHLSQCGDTILQLGLNLPGVEKFLKGINRLFQWGDERLSVVFPQLFPLYFSTDILGPWALYATPVLVAEAKYRCCAIECSQDFARLLDIDVYSSGGSVCDRDQLGLEQRACLLCSSPARECIRSQRHSPGLLRGRCEDLLRAFTA